MVGIISCVFRRGQRTQRGSVSGSASHRKGAGGRVGIRCSRRPAASGDALRARRSGEWKGPRPPALELPPLPHGVLLRSVGAGKQSWALNKPPLNVTWKPGLCRRCRCLMSLIPSGLSIFNCNSLLIWSQLPWFCDRNNGSGRWGATTPFSFNAPDRRQGRHHLEGEGQIIKKYIS